MATVVGYEVAIRHQQVEEIAKSLRAFVFIRDEFGQCLGQGMANRAFWISGDWFEQSERMFDVGLFEMFAQPLFPEFENISRIDQRFNGLIDPSILRDGFKSTGIRYTIAARITGPVDSAYPNGPPPDQKPVAGPPIAHLAKSSTPANIVVIADTDLLMDYLWVQQRQFLGQRIAQAFANNGDLIANILDNLSGSSALISIRGRASFSRPFERIDALKRQADERLRAKAMELQSELQKTESKLTELQSKRNDQSSIMLSPEQEAELKRFTADKTRVRKELRETQRSLDVDINRLGSQLKAINIAIAPLIVAIAGVVILSMRRRRRTAPVPAIKGST